MRSNYYIETFIRKKYKAKREGMGPPCSYHSPRPAPVDRLYLIFFNFNPKENDIDQQNLINMKMKVIITLSLSPGFLIIVLKYRVRQE